MALGKPNPARERRLGATTSSALGARTPPTERELMEFVLIRQDPPMSTYDEMAAAFEAHAVDSAYNAHYDRPAVLALVGDVRGCRVLDAGCGPGLYAEELVARGAEVVAVDGSEAMVALAKQRLGGTAQVLFADLNKALPFADEQFDLVVCPLVIHHLEDRASTLRQFARVLRPGGRVVLSTQHPTSDWLRKGGSYFDVRQEEDVWERGGE
jgi:2-polyprenyl-3-methyl-5-hydroxy-6-metoxy-1,4-benzoquinol methylase